MKARELSELSRSLKPCPFCGGKAELSPMPSAPTWWRVRCASYRCGGCTWAQPAPALATAAWNLRDGSQ